jgi:thiol-disulfide isomerase/thioredoxin
MKRSLLLVTSFILLGFSVASAQLAVGTKAPDFKLTDWQNSNGKKVTLASLKGKVVVLDFYTYWCGPCRRAMPDNIRIAKKYKSQGLVFVGIHSDDDVAEMKKTIKSWPISYAVGQDTGSKAASAYKVTGYPTYVFIDRKGVIRNVSLGHGDTEGIVKKLLAQK